MRLNGNDTETESPMENKIFPTKIYAIRYASRNEFFCRAFDTSNKLAIWEFKCRPVDDNEILIDIKFASIYHSDIHTMKGEWGKQQFLQVSAHEIVDIVSAVGKNGLEQHCDNHKTVFTYGVSQASELMGITQGGYSTSIVV